MAELIAVGFHGMGRAGEVLYQLQRMEDDWTVDLQDAVAVYRDTNGTLRLDSNTEPTEDQGAGWGALFGGLIGLLIAAAPVTGGPRQRPPPPWPPEGSLGGRWVRRPERSR